jgi:hypothetical protein
VRFSLSFLGVRRSFSGAMLMRERGTVVDVKGFDSTIGYTQWANKPAERDAAVRFPPYPLPLSPPHTHIYIYV